jgi:predicted patatin/cPLA2 family phospholipase
MVGIKSSNAVAMILGDGGIKAGFIAGAADEILRGSELVRERLELMWAVSASVGNIIYYLALGDRHPGQEMWTRVLTDRRFLRYSGLKDLYQERPLYDLDFMIEAIFKGTYPIDQNKVKLSNVIFYIAVQSGLVPTIKYITNGSSGVLQRGGKKIPIESAASYDLYEVIKAASAAPFIYDQTVQLGGQQYMDAAAIEPLALDLPGFDRAKKIIILTKGRSNVGKKVRYLLLAALYICCVFPFRKRRFKLHKYVQYGLKPFVVDRLVKQAQELERKGDAVLIVPEAKIGGLLDSNVETLNKTYRQGQEVARRKLHLIEKMLSTDKVEAFSS